MSVELVAKEREEKAARQPYVFDGDRLVDMFAHVDDDGAQPSIQQRARRHRAAPRFRAGGRFDRRQQQGLDLRVQVGARILVRRDDLVKQAPAALPHRSLDGDARRGEMEGRPVAARRSSSQGLAL